MLRKQLTFFGSKPFKLIKLMVKKRTVFFAPNPFNLHRCWKHHFLMVKRRHERKQSAADCFLFHCQASSINVNRSTLCDPSLCWTLWVNLNTGAGSGDGWSDGLVGFNGFWVNVHVPPLLFFTCDRKEVPCNQNIHHQRAWWINSPSGSEGFLVKRKKQLWLVSMSWYWGSPKEVLGDLKVFLTF